MKKSIFKLNKSSDSTTASNTLAQSTVISEATKGVNNNTNTMANLMIQLNSTKVIAIIIVVGILAYILVNNKKQY